MLTRSDGGQQFNLWNLVDTPDLPEAALRALFDVDPFTLVHSAATGRVSLPVDVAHRILGRLADLCEVVEPYMILRALRRVFSPEELASELAGLELSPKLAAAAIPHVSEEDAVRLLCEFGPSSLPVAMMGYVFGYSMPADLVLSLTGRMGVTPLSRFLTLTCSDLPPKVRAPHLLDASTFQWLSADNRLLVAVDAIRSPGVLEEAADLAERMDRSTLRHLRVVVARFPSKSPKAAARLLRRILGGDADTWVHHDLDGVSTNYGLPRDLREWVSSKLGGDHLYSDDAVDRLGELVAAGRPLIPAPDFEEHRVSVPLSMLSYDRRWGEADRQAVAVASHFLEGWVPHKLTAVAEDLLPVFGPRLLTQPPNRRTLWLDNPWHCDVFCLRASRSGFHLDADAVWNVQEWRTEIPAVHFDPVRKELGSDEAAWRLFVGLLARGLDLDAAAAVAAPD